MRNAIIVLACVAGLALAGFILKYAIDYYEIHKSMESGKLSGPNRDSFISSSIKSCEAQIPANVPKATAESYCTCVTYKAVDLISEDEMRSVYQTGQIPDSLAKKLEAPIKQCISDAKLGTTP